LINPYVEQIGRTHPSVEVEAQGPLYDDIVWRKGARIPKAVLDAEIAAFVPTDPDDELVVALTDLKNTGATVDQLIDALLGNAGRQGRISGRSI